MICQHCKTPGRYAVGSSRSPRLAVAGFAVPFCFTVADFDSIAVEVQALKDRNVSDSAIYILKAKKSTFKTVYHRIWKAYFTWCVAHRLHPRQCEVLVGLSTVAVEMFLALSTFKGQTIPPALADGYFTSAARPLLQQVT